MDHRKRLAYAWRQLKALERAGRIFMKREPYRATGKYDGKRRVYVAYIHRVLDMPEHWPLQVGDIVHNLRSTLDNLTYALAVKHSGIPNDQDVRKIQFPICTIHGAFHGKKGERQRRLSLLSPAAQAAIEKLQPYNTPMKPDQTHTLLVLNELANIDKHRRILLVVGAAASTSVELRGPGIPEGTSVIGYAGELQDHTEIGSWAFVSPSSSARMVHPKVDMHARLAFQVRFGQGTPAAGLAAIEALARIHAHIKNKVCPALEPLLV
jgi:hypothetical protein